MEGVVTLKSSLKSTAYDYILSRIIRCDYMPKTYIDAAQISRELGISRTPVRDAISRLESEGLVTVTPRHGIMVSEIPANEVDNISKARKLLEPYAVSVACKSADKVVMEDFRSRFLSVGSKEEQIQVEYDFNIYLMSLTQNDYMIQTMERVYTSNFRVQTMGMIQTGETSAFMELIDCIIEGRSSDATGVVIRLISAEGIF